MWLEGSEQGKRGPVNREEAITRCLQGLSPGAGTQPELQKCNRYYNCSPRGGGCLCCPGGWTLGSSLAFTCGHRTNVARGSFSRAWLKKTVPGKTLTSQHVILPQILKHPPASSRAGDSAPCCHFPRKPLSDVSRSYFFTQ